MADGDELPDHDYASIYGAEALDARQMARLDAAMALHRQSLDRIWAMLAQQAEQSGYLSPVQTQEAIERLLDEDDHG